MNEIVNRQAKILIVEDNQESIDLLVYFLKPAGYQVFTATDGVDALEMVKKCEPDVILLDIMLPKMDGFAVCERLKKDQATFHIPIIMITALKELKDKIRGLEAGADDFISKPFDNVELLTRVKSLLRLKFYHDELIRRNEELMKQRQALVREDLLKKELTNLIVHDMKNPLFVIQGNLQMMEMVQDAKATPRQQIYTQRIARSSRSLLRMILNLLDISRLEQKTMEFEAVPVVLNNLVQDVMQSFTDIPEHENKSAQLLGGEAAITAYADKEITERILENIFNFVFQNTPEGKSIQVRLGNWEESGFVGLVVSYEGQLIPDKFKRKIFLKSAQMELKRSGFKPARGLGLIFCKLAMESQGGKIYLADSSDGRNHFVLEFPSFDNFKKQKS
ncbi:MAG: hybrid sensor histidine kinase/response regulator [Calditrichia bacterium]